MLKFEASAFTLLNRALKRLLRAAAGNPVWRMLLASGVVIPGALAAASQSSSPPAVLGPYIADGDFRPGDYNWLRGAFAGATPKQVSEYNEVRAWRHDCFRSDLEATRAGLREIGVVAGAALDRMPYADLLCGQVATLPEKLDDKDWAGFSRDAAIVRPSIDGFLAAVRLSGRMGMADSDELGPALIARALEEQTLRSGIAWAANPDNAKGLTGNLTAGQRAIVGAALAIALQRRDHENTIWLKDKLAKHGWPKKSEVGPTAAKMAWLLVQHADADPVFQIQASRLMEPLVARSEVEGSDFAFLTDRILLKISGKQRYGTQLECSKGRLDPLPLANTEELASRRRGVGLNDIDTYKAETLKAIGGCGV